MTNPKWYYFDNNTNKFYLTSAAPKARKVMNFSTRLQKIITSISNEEDLRG